jgi:hypothetical protein
MIRMREKMMLDQKQIEERIKELEKGLSERGNQVIQSDGQCIAFLNQIQAYKAVLSPPPDLEKEVTREQVVHETDPTVES